MNPSDYYPARIKKLQDELKLLQQRKSALGWLRFGSIAAIFAAFYFLLQVGIVYVIVAAVLLLALFIRLLYADLRNKAAITHTETLITLNNNEIQYSKGSFGQFAGGEQYMQPDHDYANDLDIFGKASLFQYINRTTSEMGGAQLAYYLQYPSAPDVILKRQAAIKELSGKVEWIQNLQAIGNSTGITFLTQQRLSEWISEPPSFSNFKPWRWLRYLLPAIILTIVILFTFDIIGQSIFYLSLLLFAAIAYQINKVVAPIHAKLTRIADELEILSASIVHIEKASFESEQLKNLQSVFLGHHKKVSDNINTLKRLLDRLDLRYNILVSAPLNILLLWNLQQILGLEKWKKDQLNMDTWFDTLGQLEALNSLGIVCFNHPEWAFPEVVPGYFSLEGNEIGHPLILENKRVNNDVNIRHDGELMLVTGSNMAGKSTYLRSIGINVVLALAGAPVCASRLRLSHVQLISSMRITDNLAESTSTFYAELKKLKKIIEKVNKGEKVFILLDEILRGTNSLDRHTGSVALIKQLIKHHAAAIIATHDLELATLEEQFPGHIINYHFDVQVSNEELYFDYLLKPGVCKSLNASILMRKIGIEL